jgi:hypothetical protein
MLFGVQVGKPKFTKEAAKMHLINIYNPNLKLKALLVLK